MPALELQKGTTIAPALSFKYWHRPKCPVFNKDRIKIQFISQKKVCDMPRSRCWTQHDAALQQLWPLERF